MAWPPAIVCRRIALVVFGLSLLLYLMFSGILLALGLDPRVALVWGPPCRHRPYIRPPTWRRLR